MFCRFCASEIPEDSRFCPHCGKEVAPYIPAEQAEDTLSVRTEVFSFPPDTTYDVASQPIVKWLSTHEVTVTGLRCEAETLLLAGTMVPVLRHVELDWEASDDPRHYQLGMMIDSRNDFGLNRKKGGAALQKQFDRWHRDHPEYQVDCKVDIPLSLGWSSGNLTLFCYR